MRLAHLLGDQYFYYWTFQLYTEHFECKYYATKTFQHVFVFAKEGSCHFRCQENNGLLHIMLIHQRHILAVTITKEAHFKYCCG